MYIIWQSYGLIIILKIAKVHIIYVIQNILVGGAIVIFIDGWKVKLCLLI